jgi:hypothetical protein
MSETEMFLDLYPVASQSLCAWVFGGLSSVVDESELETGQEYCVWLMANGRDYRRSGSRTGNQSCVVSEPLIYPQWSGVAST